MSHQITSAIKAYPALLVRNGAGVPRGNKQS